MACRFPRRRPGRCVTCAGALHHATDTLTHIAATDRQCVHRAADGRLYIPTRLLPANCDIPTLTLGHDAPASPPVLDGYHLAVETCTAATAAFDDLAVAAATPSRALAAAHALPVSSRPHTVQQREPHLAYTPTLQPTSGRLPDGVTQPGHLENEIRNLQLTEPALLLRASAIDEAARDLLAEATAKANRQAVSCAPIRAIPGRSSGRRV